ncbi:MAG: lipopolysaccharide heptosyltransferase I, partial [Methyloprofundus sp.]|nr:lipopolysaccharide heptosyltransferase I [Methyloprofundus sp.]
FPALTDAAKAYPDITFDWVVDKTFSDVSLWHPNVKNVIKTAHRQWRKEPIKAWRDGRLPEFYRQLNAHDYDVIIDLQSNIKSAVVSWLVKGDVHGMDKDSCRERPAHWAYKYRYTVNKKQHSIEKMRDLMAQALNYTVPDKVADYGVDLSVYALPKLDFEIPEKYLLFVHNASWLTKIWSVEAWQGLIKKAVVQGYSVLLPCGNDKEYQRAQEIARVSDKAFALPLLSLNEIASITHHAHAAVCSDTGLAHLAAVANTPAVTLYGATDPNLIGTQGKEQYHVVSDLLSPSLVNAKKGAPEGMNAITVEQVWAELEPLLT